MRGVGERTTRENGNKGTESMSKQNFGIVILFSLPIWEQTETVSCLHTSRLLVISYRGGKSND